VAPIVTKDYNMCFVHVTYEQREVQGKKLKHVLQMKEEIRLAYNIMNADKWTIQKHLLISG
jgi:hypothetical protein